MQWYGAVIWGKSLLTANSYDRTGRAFLRGPATAAVAVPAVMAAIAAVTAGTAGRQRCLLAAGRESCVPAAGRLSTT